MTPTCPACGGPMLGSREPFCGECWSNVPAKVRRVVHAAAKALGYNPASPKAQREYSLAIADAAGWCT